MSLKRGKVGGVRGVMEAGKLCDELGMEINVACKTGESSIASAAAVHIAGALASNKWSVNIASPYLAEETQDEIVKAVTSFNG